MPLPFQFSPPPLVRGSADLELVGEPGGVGLIGEQTDGAAHRGLAVESALRSVQDLDALDVEQLEVRVVERIGDRDVVDVDADGGVAGGELAHAAQIDLGAVGAEVGEVERGHVARVVDEVVGAQRLERVLGEGVMVAGTSCSTASMREAGDGDLLDSRDDLGGDAAACRRFAREADGERAHRRHFDARLVGDATGGDLDLVGAGAGVQRYVAL